MALDHDLYFISMAARILGIESKVVIVAEDEPAAEEARLRSALAAIPADEALLDEKFPRIGSHLFWLNIGRDLTSVPSAIRGAAGGLREDLRLYERDETAVNTFRERLRDLLGRKGWIVKG